MVAASPPFPARTSSFPSRVTPVAQIVVFASAATIAFLASLCARDEDWLLSVGSTGIMLVFWAVNTATWLIGSFGVGSLASDTGFTLAAFALFLLSNRWWAALLSGLSGMDVLVDVLFASGAIGFGAMARIEDWIFIAQLAAASAPGWIALGDGLVGTGGDRSRKSNSSAPLYPAVPDVQER